MPTETAQQRNREPVKQFSVLTANRVGRLHDLVGVLAAGGVHVLAVGMLDATDNAVIRIVVDDPDKARVLLQDHNLPFTESELVVVALQRTEELGRLMAALLEAELNINYLYAFIPHPDDQSLLALSMEDNETAETVLQKSRFRILRQADISR